MKRKLIGIILFILAVGFLVNLIAPFDPAFIESAPTWLLVLLGLPVVIYLAFELLSLVPTTHSEDSNEEED